MFTEVPRFATAPIIRIVSIYVTHCTNVPTRLLGAHLPILTFLYMCCFNFETVNVDCGIYQPRQVIENEVCEQCDQKKSPNVNKSCPKMISLEKLKILTPLQKLPKNVCQLPKALKCCPKSNKSPNLVTLFVNVDLMAETSESCN